MSGLSYLSDALRVNLSSPTDSRYIRMEVVSNTDPSKMAGLQAEFMGCATLTDKTLDEVCCYKSIQVIMANRDMLLKMDDLS